LEIGHAAMYIKDPELTVNALVASQQENRFLVDVEREYFGFDYCQLGAALMRLWQLPEVYPQIVENHLYPERTEIDCHIQTDIINLAHQLLETPGYLGSRLSQVLAYHHQHLEIPENIEVIVLEEIASQLDDVFVLLSPPETISDELNIGETLP
jgi:HD-like signal output (HDOD) protein